MVDQVLAMEMALVPLAQVAAWADSASSAAAEVPFVQVMALLAYEEAGETSEEQKYVADDFSSVVAAAGEVESDLDVALGSNSVAWEQRCAALEEVVGGWSRYSDCIGMEGVVEMVAVALESLGDAILLSNCFFLVEEVVGVSFWEDVVDAVLVAAMDLD